MCARERGWAWRERVRNERADGARAHTSLMRRNRTRPGDSAEKNPQRHRMSMTNPTIMIANPIPRFHAWIPGMGKAHCEM